MQSRYRLVYSLSKKLFVLRNLRRSILEFLPLGLEFTLSALEFPRFIRQLFQLANGHRRTVPQSGTGVSVDVVAFAGGVGITLVVNLSGFRLGLGLLRSEFGRSLLCRLFSRICLHSGAIELGLLLLRLVIPILQQLGRSRLCQWASNLLGGLASLFGHEMLEISSNENPTPSSALGGLVS
jgi:hypothetical protein